LHFAVAPVGSVLPAAAVGAAFDAAGFAAAAAGAAAAGAAAGASVLAGAALDADAAGALFAAFCTPPWPLHAPLPVAVDVVPSLQLVVASAESAAHAGSDNANTIMGAAMSPEMFVLFIDVHSLVRIELAEKIVLETGGGWPGGVSAGPESAKWWSHS
jgi:hypothetical protein